jgi:hypothetical protein
MIDPDSLECSDTPMAYSIVRDLMRMHRLLSTRKTARSRSQSPPLRAALSGDLIRPPMCPAGFVGWRVFKLSG